MCLHSVHVAYECVLCPHSLSLQNASQLLCSLLKHVKKKLKLDGILYHHTHTHTHILLLGIFVMIES